MICEELAKGSTSSRSSTTVQRKSARSDNKRVLRNVEWKYLTENGFAKVLHKSWSGTRFSKDRSKNVFSRPDRKNQGLALVNSRLFYNFYNVPVIKKHNI